MELLAIHLAGAAVFALATCVAPFVYRARTGRYPFASRYDARTELGMFLSLAAIWPATLIVGVIIVVWTVLNIGVRWAFDKVFGSLIDPEGPRGRD